MPGSNDVCWRCGRRGADHAWSGGLGTDPPPGCRPERTYERNGAVYWTTCPLCADLCALSAWGEIAAAHDYIHIWMHRSLRSTLRDMDQRAARESWPRPAQARLTTWGTTAGEAPPTPGPQPPAQAAPSARTGPAATVEPPPAPPTMGPVAAPGGAAGSPFGGPTSRPGQSVTRKAAPSCPFTGADDSGPHEAAYSSPFGMGCPPAQGPGRTQAPEPTQETAGPSDWSAQLPTPARPGAAGGSVPSALPYAAAGARATGSPGPPDRGARGCRAHRGP